MNRYVRIFSWILVLLVLIGCIVMLFSFVATTVGLTPAEQAMLMMTSDQINSIYMDSLPILHILNSLKNVTSELIELRELLILRSKEHDLTSNSTVVLDQTSDEQEIALITYNSTIVDQTNVIQMKLDNVTLPLLNLTLPGSTITLANGTVDFSNPNSPTENVTLDYSVKSHLDTIYLEVGPASSTFSYVTVGAKNWLSLTNWQPNIFVQNATASAFTLGQVLDFQSNKISCNPVIGGREYRPELNEIRLLFDGTLTLPQPITLTEILEINVALL